MRASHFILALMLMQAAAPFAAAQAVVEYLGLTSAVVGAAPEVGKGVEAVSAAAIQKLLSEPQSVTFTESAVPTSAEAKAGDGKATDGKDVAVKDADAESDRKTASTAEEKSSDSAPTDKTEVKSP